MVRRITKLITLAAVLAAVIFSCLLPAAAVTSTAKVIIDGKNLYSEPEPCFIAGSAYVPIDDFVFMLDPSARIRVDKETGTTRIETEGLTVTIGSEDAYLVANGRYLWMGSKARVMNGSLIVPVEVLAKAFGVKVRCSTDTKTVLITGKIKPIEAADTFYDEEDLYWLSHIVFAEAGNQPLEGKIAVANVVLNRQAGKYWPDSVYGVVFDNSCGVQFSPTMTDAIYRDPSDAAVIAAKLAMDGANVVGNATFFVNPTAASSTWFDETLDFVAAIGAHNFYAMRW